MRVAIITLLMGFVLGYLAQRSRICFIGGLRDFLLVRDTDLLKGAFAFFITAWLAFSVAGALHLISWGAPSLTAAVGEGPSPARIAAPAASTGQPARQPAGANLISTLAANKTALIVAVVAGLVLGLASTLANGCPTRQHVLAAQGVRDSMLYIGGFYLGVLVYYVVTQPLLARVF